MITIRNTQRMVDVSQLRVRQLLTHIRAAAGYTQWSVGLRITSDSGIRRLNRQYRNKDKPTDILSFSNFQLASPEAFRSDLEEDERDLGDLIVSAAYVDRAAAEMGIERRQHWCTVLVHGFVHLLGYDHETDEQFQTMQAKEQSIKAALSEALETTSPGNPKHISST